MIFFCQRSGNGCIQRDYEKGFLNFSVWYTAVGTLKQIIPKTTQLVNTIYWIFIYNARSCKTILDAYLEIKHGPQ